QVVAQPTLLSRRTAQAHDRVSCRSREQDIGNAQERRSLPCPTHHAVVSRLSQPLSRANFTASFRVETSNFAKGFQPVFHGAGRYMQLLRNFLVRQAGVENAQGVQFSLREKVSRPRRLRQAIVDADQALDFSDEGIPKTVLWQLGFAVQQSAQRRQEL